MFTRDAANLLAAAAPVVRSPTAQFAEGCSQAGQPGLGARKGLFLGPSGVALALATAATVHARQDWADAAAGWLRADARMMAGSSDLTLGTGFSGLTWASCALAAVDDRYRGAADRLVEMTCVQLHALHRQARLYQPLCSNYNVQQGAAGHIKMLLAVLSLLGDRAPERDLVVGAARQRGKFLVSIVLNERGGALGGASLSSNEVQEDMHPSQLALSYPTTMLQGAAGLLTALHAIQEAELSVPDIGLAVARLTDWLQAQALPSGPAAGVCMVWPQWVPLRHEQPVLPVSNADSWAVGGVGILLALHRRSGDIALRQARGLLDGCRPEHRGLFHGQEGWTLTKRELYDDVSARRLASRPEVAPVWTDDLAEVPLDLEHGLAGMLLAQFAGLGVGEPARALIA